MVTSGDELGHTQHGNNNAYCQDNELSWLDWQLDAEQAGVPGIRLPADRLAARAPGVQPPPLPAGRDPDTDEGLAGNHLAGARRTGDGRGRLAQAFARCLGIYLAGAAIQRPGPRGEAIKDSDFLLLLNAHHETITFQIAEILSAKSWVTVLDSAAEGTPLAIPAAPREYPLHGRSLVLLEEVPTG